ncbi:MAG: long-chain fatty acid--CoA ligase [Clostridia bacterium]|jgi:long-chain acyl-CoA synthetase|nr:long-chain fatty acid--CoA ligase [Clostridia bacterium]
MEKQKNRVVYQAEPVKDFRELITRTTNQYPDHIAYKYKIRKSKEEVEHVNKTYSEFKADIEAVSTSLLNLGLKGKKVAVIRK